MTKQCRWKSPEFSKKDNWLILAKGHILDNFRNYSLVSDVMETCCMAKLTRKNLDVFCHLSYFFLRVLVGTAGKKQVDLVFSRAIGWCWADGT